MLAGASGPFCFIGRLLLAFHLLAAFALLVLLLLVRLVERVLFGFQNGADGLFLVLPDGVAFLVAALLQRMELLAGVVVDDVELGDLVVVQLDLLPHLVDAAFANFFGINLAAAARWARRSLTVFTMYSR